MADIELIVKIPEEKIAIEYGEVVSIGRNNDKELADYILAGTPITFLKYRMKDYVCYNVDWLKERWEMEMKLLGVDFSKHDEEVIKETVASVWGKPPYIELLDKIRAELHATAEMHEDDVYYLREEWIDEIIDKYRKGQTDADSD